MTPKQFTELIGKMEKALAGMEAQVKILKAALAEIRRICAEQHK